MKVNNNHYALIMAGGVGSRFWPMSTSQFPKQFHDVMGSGYTLIQKTFNRLKNVVPSHQIYILTNERYIDLVAEQLPEINLDQIISEPAMRNTAPCILYAALKIKKINPKASLIVAPSDHWIEDEDAFASDIAIAFNKADDQKSLITLGIRPSFPNTGYGYIQYSMVETGPVFPVLQFTEKPDYETAKKFIEAKNYVWNAGIFVWSVQAICNAFEKYQPTMNSLFMNGWNALNTSEEKEFIDFNYKESENISIDYAILEPSNSVCLIEASFDWNDLGSWGSLYDKLDKDEDQNVVINATSMLQNASGNMIRTSKDKLVVVDGLKDYIVVDKEDVLLIFPKEKDQDIKKILSTLKDNFGNTYS